MKPRSILQGTAVALLAAAGFAPLLSAQTVAGLLVTQKSHRPVSGAQLTLLHEGGQVAAQNGERQRDGRIDISTFQLISSDDYLFTASVRHAFSRARFEPAELNGRAVPEVFEINADFGFGNDPPRIAARNLITIRATPAWPEH